MCDFCKSPDGTHGKVSDDVTACIGPSDVETPWDKATTLEPRSDLPLDDKSEGMTQDQAASKIVAAVKGKQIRNALKKGEMDRYVDADRVNKIAGRKKKGAGLLPGQLLS